MSRNFAIYFLLLTAASAAGGALRFDGVIRDRDRVLVALRDSETRMAAWIRIGDSFEGYVAHNYEPERESLSLTKDGQTHLLHLVQGGVRDIKTLPRLGDPASLRGLELAYALAIAGDDTLEQLVMRLHECVKERMALSEKLREAVARFEQTRSEDDEIRLKEQKASIRAQVMAEQLLRDRLTELAESKRPNSERSDSP